MSGTEDRSTSDDGSAWIAAAPSRERQPNWLGWGLALAILVGCALVVDWGQFWAALRALELRQIVLLVLIATADRLVMAYKWGLLLRVAGVASPMPRIIAIFYQANFVGTFLPSHVGGDVLRAYWVMKDSGIGHPVAASLLVERILGLVSAVNWAILGGTVFAIALWPARAGLWLGLAVLAGLAANLLFASLLSRRVHRFVLGHLGRFAHRKPARLLHDFAAACAEFGRDRRALAVNLGLTLFEQSLQMLLICSIAASIGVQAEPIAFAAATTLYMLLVRVPIAPDGWGVGELAAIGVFSLIDVGATQAFTVSLIAHVIPMLALTPGLLVLLRRRSFPGTLDVRRR
jgi:uncharacterized protein (TIRG00374 family)